MTREVIKSVLLTEEQLDLIVDILKQRRTDIDSILKDKDGLEAVTIQGLELEHRDITDVLRELQHYAINKDK